MPFTCSTAHTKSVAFSTGRLALIAASILTNKVGRVVVRLDRQADVLEKVDDFLCLAEVGRLNGMDGDGERKTNVTSACHVKSRSDEPAGSTAGAYLAVAQQKETVEHVEDLRRRLVNGEHDRLVLLARVVFQRGHEAVRRARVQAGRRLLRTESIAQHVG